MYLLSVGLYLWNVCVVATYYLKIAMNITTEGTKGIGSNLYEVKSDFLGLGESIAGDHDAELVTFGGDYSYLGSADTVVNPNLRSIVGAFIAVRAIGRFIWFLGGCHLCVFLVSPGVLRQREAHGPARYRRERFIVLLLRVAEPDESDAG